LIRDGSWKPAPLLRQQKKPGAENRCECSQRRTALLYPTRPDSGQRLSSWHLLKQRAERESVA
jgi:hypothetical protein